MVYQILNFIFNNPEKRGYKLDMIGDKGENLIFLISQPRAGSTMLQRILASHPLILSSAEPWLMLNPVYGIKRTELQNDYNPHWAYGAVQDFLKHYTDGEETYFEAVRAFANILYGKALQGTEKKLFLDKTPRYYLIIPELYHLFPKAKFIFLLRNPLAVLYSIISTWLADGNWPHLHQFRNDLLLAPNLILQSTDIQSSKAYFIRYEDIITNPKKTIASLCKGLELSFHTDMLTYGDNEPPKGCFGDVIGVGKHDKPTNSSLNKWICLSEKQQTKHFALAYLEALGPETIKKMGYSFFDLRSTIGMNKKGLSKEIVPWDIAIKPPSSWTPKEHLKVNIAMAIQKKGGIGGLLYFIIKTYRGLIRSLL